MNVRKVDDDGTLWFLSAGDSSQNCGLAADPSVRLHFQGSPYSNFLTPSGQANIEELWEPLIKTWFTGGVDDPRITVIRVAVDDGYYWDTKHGNTIAFAKMLVGAANGKTHDDSIEGKLKV
jgi:general stress protein 26